MHTPPHPTPPHPTPPNPTPPHPTPPHPTPPHPTPPHPTPPLHIPLPHPTPPYCTLLHTPSHSVGSHPIPTSCVGMCSYLYLTPFLLPPNHCKPPNPTTVYYMQRVGFHIALRFIGRLSGTSLKPTSGRKNT